MLDWLKKLWGRLGGTDDKVRMHEEVVIKLTKVKKGE